jgi:hypothetical protein
MSSYGDIESAMQRRVEDERRQVEIAARELAAKAAVGADAARGFIELMRKYDVTPETVYRHEQVRLSGRNHFLRGFFPKPDKVIERFEPVDRGWVVRYSLTEYGDPWLMLYLRPDGLVNDCETHSFTTGFPCEGLIEAPARTALGRGRAVCVKRYSTKEPSSPFLTVDEYATAARWYLDRTLTR